MSDHILRMAKAIRASTNTILEPQECLAAAEAAFEALELLPLYSVNGDDTMAYVSLDDLFTDYGIEDGEGLELRLGLEYGIEWVQK